MNTNNASFRSLEKLPLQPKISLNEKKYRDTPKKSKCARLLLLAFAGLFIGFVNGYLGAGGGMLLVPALTVIAGLAEKKAHATAIAIILPLSAVSAAVYIASGGLSNAPTLPVMAGVLLGGVIGAVALNKFSNKALSFFFYIVMIAAGVKMIVG